MIALAIGAVSLGGDWFVTFWLIAGLAIVWEWQAMIEAPRARERFLAGCVALVLVTVFARQAAHELAFVLLAAGCVALAWLAGPGKRVWASAGLVYAAGLVVCVSLLRLSLFDGLDAIVWLFAVVWGTDICAYFGGRMIGGPKLWPRVSPKKTWAGFLTGVTCGAVLGVIAVALVHALPTPPLWPLFLLGLLTGAVSQAGDLFESAMKRRFGVKDSSALIPGHGGVMDRLDGFIFAAVFAAIIGVVRQGPGAMAIGLLRW
jgi:phosphatidate cytidylyltransferase